MQLPTANNGQPLVLSLRLDMQFQIAALEQHYRKHKLLCMASG